MTFVQLSKMQIDPFCFLLHFMDWKSGRKRLYF